MCDEFLLLITIDAETGFLPYGFFMEKPIFYPGFSETLFFLNETMFSKNNGSGCAFLLHIVGLKCHNPEIAHFKMSFSYILEHVQRNLQWVCAEKQCFPFLFVLLKKKKKTFSAPTVNLFLSRHFVFRMVSNL